MRTHRLKTWPSYFRRVWEGEKPFEVRKDDRDFDVGDELILMEWDPSHPSVIDDGKITGREIHTIITYKLPGGNFGIESGYCVLGIPNIERREAQP